MLFRSLGRTAGGDPPALPDGALDIELVLEAFEQTAVGLTLISLDGTFLRVNRTFCEMTGYAREELVAELGAAFLCADLELTPEVREDHAAYIATWLTVLQNDNRAIFQAASHAQRAVDYLHGLQSERPEAAA